MTGSGNGTARRTAVAVALVAGLVSGCSVNPAQAIPLPFRAGVGAGSYTVTVEMADVTNLVPNAEVKVADVTVGTITSIAFDNWVARLTLGLDGGVRLPANSTARIGQKSLLGAEYLELDPPAKDIATGTLRDGDTIPLAATSRYPETEEVLAALSVVLNGGGLQQIRTITTELDAALSGREGDIRALIGNLQTFVGSLEKQKDDINRAIDGLNRLSGELAAQNATLATAIRTIPAGLAALEQQRGRLVDGLGAISQLGDVSARVLGGTKDDLIGNLHDLRPALQKLADSGQNLTQSISVIATFPFPAHTAFPAVLKGDYGNLFVTLDLNPAVLARNYGLGFAGGPQELPLGGLPPLGAGVTGGNPLRLPIDPPALRGAPLPVLPIPLGPLSAPRDTTPAPAATATPAPTASPGLLGNLFGGGS